ncbi:MAG: hypothetical protein ACOC2W_02230 [bacterium]
MKNNRKNSKKNKLLLLKFNQDDKKIKLTENELKLKEKLLDIEDKLSSIDKITETIEQEKDDTIFKTEAFDMLVSSVAITAAVYTVAEYLGVDVDKIDKLL